MLIHSFSPLLTVVGSLTKWRPVSANILGCLSGLPSVLPQRTLFYTSCRPSVLLLPFGLRMVSRTGTPTGLVAACTRVPVQFSRY